MNNLLYTILAKSGPGQVIIVAFLAVVAITAFVFILLFLKFFRLWLQAKLSRADVKFTELIGMWLRKVDIRTIVIGKITAIQAGVPNVVRALIAANRANIELTLKTATAIDLAGRDILEAVQTSVNPKVIDCPDPERSRGTVDAVAQDGIQLKATQETIVARVGEGIVTTIGSALSYKSVLENPDKISKSVLAKGLDAGTAYEILSIDIADVDVGDNIGAQLQAKQAEADMRRAKAEAEKRRAMAVAREQEMRALVVENEAKVPLAIAEAFRQGNLGIMDYYRLKNIGADTQMRESIAKPEKKE
ncbi:MAG: flotillin-like FloA family protein [Planctomycetota bacterium]|jgi:uncharacterized protein YqfA (UPF0365 family)